MPKNSEINHFTAGFIIGVILVLVGCVIIF